jgi:hypothetical protein
MENNVSFAMAKENFLNENVTVEEARDAKNVLVLSGSRTAVTDQVEQWNGQGLVDSYDISGGGGGAGPTVKNASVGVHDGIIQQDRDYRISVSGEIKEVPDNGTRIGPSTVSGVSRAPGLRSIFTYTGEITSFEADRKVSIKQGGRIIRGGTQEPPPDPDPPPNEQPPDPDPLPTPQGGGGNLRVIFRSSGDAEAFLERKGVPAGWTYNKNNGRSLIFTVPDPRGIADRLSQGSGPQIVLSAERINAPTPPPPDDPPPEDPPPEDPPPEDPPPDDSDESAMAGFGAPTIALIGAASIGAYLIGQNS